MKEQIIKITKDLEQGTISETEAQNLLLNLFGSSCSMGKPHDAHIKLDNGEEVRVYVDPEIYYNR